MKKALAGCHALCGVTSVSVWNKRGEFNLPHQHAVLEAKVSCSDYYNPHHRPAVKP